eukprot:TRINITY_DN7083_c0_g1_i1.p1 TRINITY_DN7083_c0_g1~~TRINITY_DN7083_c0_g1_i1.p1  ORF type:complete len:130 (-),score=28.74 TRINITY_DN7083_c0_g1_i1:67-456(-)
MSAPPVSLEQLYKMHQMKQSKIRQDNEALKTEVIHSVGKVTNGMMDSINVGVSHVFLNQKQLETETKILDHQSKKLRKQSQLWMNLLDDFNKALKELGSVEHWSRQIESDVRDISDTLSYLHSQRQIDE